MRSEIDRIRNTNFEDLDRRVNENQQLLEIMRCCLEQNQCTTPMALLNPISRKGSKLPVVKGLLHDLIVFQRSLRQQVVKFVQINRQLLDDMMRRFVEELRIKDDTIQQLQERLERQQISMSFQSESEKALQSTQSQDQLLQKAQQPSRLKQLHLHHNNSISAKVLHNDRQGITELFGHQESKRKQSGNLHSHRMFAHSKQQLSIPEGMAEFPPSAHKRNLSNQNGLYGGDDITKDAIRKKASEMIGKGIINSANDAMNITANFAKPTLVGREGFHMHSNNSFAAASSIRQLERLAERQANKENGPVLPKPLRKNSIDSARGASQQQALPEIPYISMPIVGKSATDNGFGIWAVNGQEMYRGLWKAGVFDGRGKLKGNGWLYEGEFKNGEIDGNGILAFGQGYKWVGKFSHNRPDGQGCLTFSGRSVTGTWKKGTLQKKSSDSTAFL